MDYDPSISGSFGTYDIISCKYNGVVKEVKLFLLWKGEIHALKVNLLSGLVGRRWS